MSAEASQVELCLRLLLMYSLLIRTDSMASLAAPVLGRGESPRQLGGGRCLGRAVGADDVLSDSGLCIGLFIGPDSKSSSEE